MPGQIDLDPQQRSQLSKVTDEPMLPLDSKQILAVGTILLKSGLPTSVTMISSFISGLVCLQFAAKYGTASELAGATLGFTWSTVFCVGILSSINQGFSVLAAQLVGAKKYVELGELFQKNVCVIVGLIVPLLLSLYFSDSILLAIGLKYEVSINTGIYLRHVIPSVIGLGIFECLKYYLIAQNYFYIQPVIQGSLAIINVFWCYLFVDILEMSIAGVAIAKSITDLSSAALLWLYIKFSGKFNESWIPWKESCLQNLGSYLKQTLVIGANSYVEWISLEVSLFIVGILNDEYILGAQGLGITLMNVLFMLPLGNAISMQAYIGNAMGEGCQHKAKKYLCVGLSINMVMTMINVLILTVWSEKLAAFFTGDEITKEILKNMLNIYSFGHIADTFVNHLTSALRTVGNEKEVFICFVMSYTVVAVSCEWIFGILFGYGYPAVWGSMISGMYLMCIWAIWKMYNLDWGKELAKIRERVEIFEAETKGAYIEMKEVL